MLNALLANGVIIGFLGVVAGFSGLANGVTVATVLTTGEFSCFGRGVVPVVGTPTCGN